MDNQIGVFFDSIYEDETGIACIALKDSSGFKHSFFQWPERKNYMIKYVETCASVGDVYFAPALFHSESAKKQNVKGARVVWVDFDGNAPAETVANMPPPSIKIKTSGTGHEHWYWKINTMLGVEDLESINRALTFALNADISGWDACQVLRPPDTFNHKRSLPTSNIFITDKTYSLESFAWMPKGESLPDRINVDPSKILPLEQLIFKYSFPQYVIDLFTKGTANRSDGLMQLGFELAERQVANEDMLSIMVHADKRWGKFAERDDQFNRLLDLISIARYKYPTITSDAQFTIKSKSMGFLDIINSDVTIDWLIEGLLETKGNCMVTGAPGAGKTQFSLHVAECLALGKPFLDFKIPIPRKVGLFSLEMDQATMKVFLSKNAKAYSNDEQKTLNDNFRIFPLGQPLHMNLPEQQEIVKQIVIQEGLEVICIDSLSQATNASLVEEGAIRALMGWMSHLRQSTGVAIWWVHHNRKNGAGNGKPKNLEDIFGSVYITSAVTSAVTLWPNGKNNLIELNFLKTRLTERGGPVNMERSRETLLFSRHSSSVEDSIEIIPSLEYNPIFNTGKLIGL